MNLLIENAKQILTCSSNRTKFKSGRYQSDIGLLENQSIYIENGIIKWIGKKLPSDIKQKSPHKIDAKKKVITPGFIDSHTHLVFAGDRSDEYGMRMKGITYQQISDSGGGISKTVESVRNSSRKKLEELARENLKLSASFGVTTIEIKSGYGLDTKNEIKILEVIKQLNKESDLDVYSTFLGAHTFPKEVKRNDYIEEILYSMIPKIREKNLADFIDVFCEKNYFTPKETEVILKQGVNFGFIPKLHTNQFNSFGGIEIAVRNDAVSVDHLEVMTDSDIDTLAKSNTVACLLPGVSYFIDIPYAPARKLIGKNIPVCIATDFNPGSCMTNNMQLIMSFAVHKLKMSVEEVINSVTINAAAALGISERIGSIEIGKSADILIFDIPEYQYMFYNFGVNNIKYVVKRGKIIFKN